MANVVIADVGKLDFQTTRKVVDLVESEEQITDDRLSVIDYENVHKVPLDSHSVYMPSTLMDGSHVKDGNVYFDLELYPFFQKAREVISKNTKGVFRLRRIVGDEDNSIIASDLYVLSTVFGEPEHVYVKRSREDIATQHVIVTVNFGGGTMAHLDYTFSGQEYIELEWSGMQRIIEFNSNEMNPFGSKLHTALPLSYSVDAILKLSYQVDDELVEKLEQFQQVVDGGVHS
ncbi:hypothetical protein ACFSTA_08705 [Ornithinibacillus salinisoli]|uniref:Uncharacterized protein n=1 Tax=Ornithinibacillus salinisoli TaxID=1848459 RepID=A0ABW4VZA9_9BACI